MMATQSNPSGARNPKRRGFWVDPRFAVGIILIAVSVVGVWALVTAADSSVEVLVARSTLTPGQRATVADFRAAKLRAAEAESLYLTAADIPTEGVIVSRVVAAGELVPVSAVGSAASVELTSLVLDVASRLPGSVGPGSQVDIWSAREVENGVFDAPIVIVPSAIVVRLIDPSGLVVDKSKASVEVLIPKFATARVLEAVANGAAISIVPVDLPIGG
jgi:hypothetical protein